MVIMEACLETFVPMKMEEFCFLVHFLPINDVVRDSNTDLKRRLSIEQPLL